MHRNIKTQDIIICAKRNKSRHFPCSHKYCLPCQLHVQDGIKIRIAEGGLRIVVTRCFVVVMNEAARRSYPRNAKHSAVNRKREARRAARESRPADRLIIGLPSLPDANGPLGTRGGSARARSRYYVRSRIDPKVV